MSGATSILPMPRSARPAKPARHEFHDSVLRAECVEALAPAPGKVILDGTLGAGGHAMALLARGATVVGMDQDPVALEFATQRLAEWSDRFHPLRGNFADAAERLDAAGFGPLDGVLLDLGVSSHQLDTAERGFSFQADGPLDMRMDPEGPITAADLVNTMSGEQLERIFREYGEEPAARRIAARITRDRLVRPFQRTLELAEAIESVNPRRGRVHPATRVFQGIRIAVNRELESLDRGLAALAARLAPAGRFAVISFHSLEDKKVKTFFKERSAEWLDRPEWPAARPNPDCIFRSVTRKAITAAPEEIRANPRARSAKLRVVERRTA